jgi:hypothetical protein
MRCGGITTRKETRKRPRDRKGSRFTSRAVRRSRALISSSASHDDRRRMIDAECLHPKIQ